jgi:butyryl-CoA dehydrogenase
LVYTRFGGVKGYKGIGGLLVEKGSPGFTFGKQEKFMGLRGMPSCDLIFDNVRVPKKNLVIAPGEFGKLMWTFDIERCGMLRCVWGSRAARSRGKSLRHGKKGLHRPICEFQAVQFMMADMAAKIDAARLLVYRAVSGAGQGLPSIYEASMAKAYANEMVVDVTSTAMQVFGGYGYSMEFPVERMYRDAKAWGVAGGTIQMLKIGIAGMIFGRRFDQRK